MTHLHIESVGKGPDFMLLHGWAMHGGIWDGIRDQLCKQFRLHVVDLPGHGLSPVCEHITMNHLIEVLINMMPERCIVGGWSLGGQIAIELALYEPKLVQQLILVSTTPCFAKRDDWKWGMEPRLLQMLMENLKQNYTAAIKRFLALQMRGDRNAIAILPQLRERIFQCAEPDPIALQAGLQILLDNDLRDRLQAVKQPILLLHGENDVITHPEAARWMYKQLPQSQLFMFSNCGHAPFLSYPNQFISCLNDFCIRPQ
jgi:pimeloyl-[acyl-carrier protein] methyl ester esterase